MQTVSHLPILSGKAKDKCASVKSGQTVVRFAEFEFIIALRE
jgi:hypothetical protein